MERQKEAAAAEEDYLMAQRSNAVHVCITELVEQREAVERAVNEHEDDNEFRCLRTGRIGRVCDMHGKSHITRAAHVYVHMHVHVALRLSNYGGGET